MFVVWLVRTAKQVQEKIPIKNVGYCQRRKCCI